MLKRIEIVNFRGISSLQADVGALTAFLGPNSSGKTTVLQAVRVAVDALSLALESERAARVVQRGANPWIEVRPGLLDASRLLPLSDWRAMFANQSVAQGTQIAFLLTFDSTDPIQVLQVAVEIVAHYQLKLHVSVLAPSAIAAVRGLSPNWGQINQTLRPWLVEHAPVAVFVPPFYGVVLNEELRVRPVVDRLLGSADQSHVVRNLVATIEPDWFQRLNNFLALAINTRLTYRTSGDELQRESPLQVYFHDTDGELEISAAGAGLVNLVALYAALSRWRQEAQRRPVIFLLDEPEAHLHPRLQADSTWQLGRLVTTEFGAQLLLATHSVEILNRLSENGARLIRCDRTAIPSAVTLESDAALFDDLAGWSDLTPYTAINFLASRRVLFCEGIGDKEALPRLAAVRYRNDPDRLRRFRQWSIVGLEGASNERIAELLARLVRNDAIRAQARQGGFQMMVVLDRDHARTPGITERSVDGVSETRVVWSRHSIESLLVEAPVLSAWIRAALPDVAIPDDLDSRIAAAVAHVDKDRALNDAAADQIAALSLRGDIVGSDGAVLHGDQRVVHALRRSREAVQSNPAAWQRGKDRAAAVLDAIRPAVGVPARHHFPSDVLRLMAKADINRFPDTVLSIPAEINEVLDRMSRP